MFLFKKLKFKNVESLRIDLAELDGHSICDVIALSKEEVLYLFRAHKLYFYDDGYEYIPIFFDGENRLGCMDVEDAEGHLTMNDVLVITIATNKLI